MAAASPLHLTVRMPIELRDRLRDSASDNRRSLNSEIVHVLDRALAAEKAKDPASVGALPGHGSNNPHPENVDEHCKE